MSRLERILAALAALPFGLGLSTGPEAPPADDVAFTFADPEIIESSGLLAHDGLFATVNDSGDGGRVFTVDPATGQTVAVTTWDGEPADVEAMAPLPGGDVLVGDIGDNAHQRDALELVQVPFGRDGAVTPTTYELVYPDRAHDAESLLVHPRTGRVLVVAKEFVGRLYAAPAELSADGPNELEEIGEVLPIATDGAFFPDGDHFVLRSYGGATFYRWPSLEEVGEIDLPSQPQGEGIAVDADDDVFISTEGQFSDVLEVPLPKGIRTEVSGPDASPTPSTSPAEDATGDPADEPDDETTRPLWPWAVGAIVGVVVLSVLLRSLRPR